MEKTDTNGELESLTLKFSTCRNLDYKFLDLQLAKDLTPCLFW